MGNMEKKCPKKFHGPAFFGKKAGPELLWLNVPVAPRATAKAGPR